MTDTDFYKRFHLDKELVRKTGFNPYYRKIQFPLDNELVIDNKKYINLAANNYLGLANDPRVKKAMCDTIEQYGSSLCGTPVSTGYAELLNQLETRLARFVNLEDAIIFPSCYQANTGLLSTIAGKEDLVIIDHYAHSSLVQGIKGSGSKIRPFLHNNIDSLAKCLGRSKNFRQTFVVTESVFSTEGSITPLNKIIKLCAKHKAIPIIDDSHGIGVLGKGGQGVLEQQKIKNFSGIYTASLGKALAASGGIIAGKKQLIDYLRYYCPHLVYSTALVPATLGAISRVIEIIEKEFTFIGQKMWDNKKLIYRELLNSGFNLVPGKAPINSIITGSSEKTIILAKKLYNKGILVTPFIEPSVPPKQGIVRLIASANLNAENINRVVTAFKEISNGDSR
jgi:7-keto-8-aminopelargonate synthetase-like enzyme